MGAARRRSQRRAGPRRLLQPRSAARRRGRPLPPHQRPSLRRRRPPRGGATHAKESRGGGDLKAWSAPSSSGVTSVVNLNLALAPAAYARRRPCALAFDPVRIEGLRSQLSWFNTVTFRYCLYTHTDTPPHTPFLTLRELVAAPPRLPKRNSRRLLLPSPVAPSPRVPGRIHVAT